ncbi:MAG TPA: hypothetical protein VNN25_00190 [Thermoanaerobaculia bacterium]|nr:hypothetical protein [Thermoanaerobaculia bacterium]
MPGESGLIFLESVLTARESVLEFGESGLNTFESVFKSFESVLIFFESVLKLLEPGLKSGESVLMFLESVLIFFESVFKLEIDQGSVGGSESPDFGQKRAKIDEVVPQRTSVIPANAISLRSRCAGQREGRSAVTTRRSAG